MMRAMCAYFVYIEITILDLVVSTSRTPRFVREGQVRFLSGGDTSDHSSD